MTKLDASHAPVDDAPDSAPSAYAHEIVLMQRCARGEASAFETLIQPYRSKLQFYLRRNVADPDDADDILQDVLVKALKYLREHPGKVTAFFPWLKTVTTNTMHDYWQRHSKRATVSLDEEGAAEIADDAPTPEGRLVEDEAQQASRSLWDFISAQLREVFLDSTRSQTEKVNGALRLLAFLYYYRDGKHVPELQPLLNAHAARLGVEPPTATTLNNWLAGGRLLRQVMQHLLEAHADYLHTTIALTIARIAYTRLERGIAVAYWCDGQDIALIQAAQRCTPPDCRELQMVRARVRDAARRKSRASAPVVEDAASCPLTAEGIAFLYHSVTEQLHDALFRMTKDTLHDIRKVDGGR